MMKIKKIASSEALRRSKEKCLEVLNVFVDLCERNNLTYWLDGGSLLGAIRHEGMIPWDDDIDVCLPEEDYVKALDLLFEFSKGDNPYLMFFHGSGFRFCYDYFGDASTLVDGIYPARIDLICVKYVKNTPEAIAIDNSWANIASIYYKGYAKHPDRILETHHHLLPKGENLLTENEAFFNAYFEYMKEGRGLPYADSDALFYYATNDFLSPKKDRPHFSCSMLFPLKKASFEGRMLSVPNDTHHYLTNLYGESYNQLPPEDQRKHHMTFMATSSVNKWKWSAFMIDFYKSGFYNGVITKRNKKLWRPFMKAKTFTLLLLKYTFSGQLSMVKGLVWYSSNKIKS